VSLSIAHFMPCYRGPLQIEAAYGLVRDAAWAGMNGHDFAPFYRASFSVECARNYAVEHAAADLLLMQDADVYASDVSALGLLVERWQETGAAVIGAAVATRRRDLLVANCEPYVPNACVEGVVGTGLMLIDLRQVRALPAPWFRVEYNATGSEVVVGEDIGFCRRVRAAGLRVLVDSTFRTVHIDERELVLGAP
jgi:hypothetical protein